MKYRVIVADDEDVIRKGIVQLVDWEQLNCRVVQECVNGEQVLSYLRENEADIVITDIKMPKMDGIQLLKEVYEQNRETQMIILTAFSDFEFAQKALRYGAVDFVIKNDFITELPKAVRIAVERAEKVAGSGEKAELTTEEYRNVQGYILESLALSKMLNDPEDVHRYRLDGRSYCVCSCEISYFDPSVEPVNTVQMLKNFLNTIVNQHTYYIVNIHETEMTFIISEDRQRGLSLQDITSMCGEILRIVEEFMRIYIKFGVSTIIDDVYALPTAFQESVLALSRSASFGNEIVFYVEEPQSRNTPNLDADSTKLVEALFQKQLGEATRLLERLKQEVIESHYPFSKVKVKIMNLCSAIFRKFGECYINEAIENMEDSVYNRVSRSTTLYTLFETCQEMMNQIAEIAGKQYEKHYLVDQIERFIQGNFQKNITLQDIADQVHISTTYVSRLYRNKTGLTITEAINHTRIDQAKQLLKNPQLKVYEIAQRVGYEDAAYFTNVFTKYVGCNPSEFRNRG